MTERSDSTHSSSEAPTGDSASVWKHELYERLRRGPDPERAAGLAADLVENAAKPLLDAADEHPLSFARIVSALCATAPFFVPFLKRHTDWLPALVAEDFDAPLSPAALRERLEASRPVDSDGPDQESDRLRRFKYYELARITARDASEEWLPLERSGETLRELSALADALLEEAMRSASGAVAESHGAPRWLDAAGEVVELGLSVLGLGKLGSEELNYSSDVDLIYVHETPLDGDARPGAPGGPTELGPAEYFTRVAQRFGRLVTERSAEGFLYRIDLDLRPEGAQGGLVISDGAFEQYHESWAETWEKAAFMKARPVAGDLALGWRTIRAMAPMLYRASMDYSTVEGIRDLKDKIEEARSRDDEGFDVKVGVGGIRDIEFIVQAMQLLHGGRILQLRERSTPRSLEQLGELDLLPRDESSELLGAYRFLRRLENRLQMEAERQTHLLAEDDERRLRAALAMGYGSCEDPLATFADDLNAHRARARSSFQALMPESGAERVRTIFEDGAPQLFRFPTTARMLGDLAEHFSREIDAHSEPERSLNNLARFIEGLGQGRFYYDLLLDRPELVPRLTALFAASNHLSTILARHPRLIEPVFSDPDVLLFDRAALADDLRALSASEDRAGDPVERTLDALRLFHHRHVLNVGLLDLAGRISLEEAEASLSDVAEVCLEGALRLAEEQLAERRAALAVGDRVRFLVVGMGKLATRELSYGSDLDLIFLFDVENGGDAERTQAIDYCVRLAQRLISALQTNTAEGSCYEIDARLRPSGNQGTLVTSLPGFARYHHGHDERSAEAWERQALLRARPVGGDDGLATRFETLRREILDAPAPPDVRAEVHRIRMRMEAELAHETQAVRDFKTGRGGVLDVESVVQVLQLESDTETSGLHDAVPLATMLERLASAGRLDDAQATLLREGWHFLKTLSSRLRIVENRSISELDQERGDLEGLARRMGYEPSGREGGARRALLRDYTHHTEALRGIYEEIFAG